jgi:N-acetylneuraminic acid mutarotase
MSKFLVNSKLLSHFSGEFSDKCEKYYNSYNGIHLLKSTWLSLTAAIFITVISFCPFLAASQFIFSSSIPNSQPASSWIKGPSMPTPRSSVAGVIMHEKIYIFGGWSVPDIHPEMHLKTDKVEVYDIKNKTWSSIAPLPKKLDHVGAAEFNGKLYVVGGAFGSLNYASDKLFIYDPASDKWNQGKPMPTARSALTAEFINGILYAVGGQDFNGVPVDTNEAYDPKTDTWTSKAPMPTPRHHLTSAVVDGRMYVIGGRTISNSSSSWINVNSNEIYDPINDTWTSKSPMPSNRSGLAAAATTDGNIYVFGGEDAIPLVAFDNNEKYDPKIDKWTVETPMPTARHGTAALFDSMNNRIYVIGGGIEAACCSSNINEVFLIGKG